MANTKSQTSMTINVLRLASAVQAVGMVVCQNPTGEEERNIDRTARLSLGKFCTGK